MKCGYRLIILLVFLMVLISSVKAQQTIAVLELESKGVYPIEASALTDRLRAELFNTGKFRVVEREVMDKILSEQGFQMTGACTSTECVVKVGQILGVEQMIAGSVSKVGNTFSVYSRLVEVESGEIVRVATYDYKGEIDNLLSSGMEYVALILAGEKVEKPIINKPTYKNTSQYKPTINTKTNYKDVGRAVGLSIFIPGAGQFYNDEDVKGVGLLVATIGSYIICGINWPHKVFEESTYVDTYLDLTVTDHYFVEKGNQDKASLYLVIGAIFHLFSVIDAKDSAKRINNDIENAYHEVPLFHDISLSFIPIYYESIMLKPRVNLIYRF